MGFLKYLQEEVGGSYSAADIFNNLSPEEIVESANNYADKWRRLYIKLKKLYLEQSSCYNDFMDFVERNCTNQKR
jgi:hypothetical protein